jgi:hypothetical protein
MSDWGRRAVASTTGSNVFGREGSRQGGCESPFSPGKELNPQDGRAYALLEMNRVSASRWNKATSSLRCRVVS